MTAPSLVWFRHDLRLDDNPALRAASERGGPIIPVFLWSPEEEGRWGPASASRWWLHQTLAALERELGRHQSQLVIRRGEAKELLRRLVRETGAEAVYWNRRYEPAVIARDTEVKNALKKDGLTVDSFNANLLIEPWNVRTKQDAPFQVYTAFWNAVSARCGEVEPEPAPSLKSPDQWPSSDSLDALKLEPHVDWAGGMRETWTPGSAGAEKRFEVFLESALDDYDEERNRPDHDGTSALSPHLHFGEISPRRLWQAISDRMKDGRRAPRPAWEVYRKELVWREFAHHLLFHFNHTPDKPLREQFEKFEWEYDRKGLKAWQMGQTGYPIVDAGMRQLWHTGWMHNRVRMIVASFLTKDLRIHWLRGAEWFWDTLVDADLANNTLGWQWTAGCGADAAPYFRVFNPTMQGEKFDPEGHYVRRWVPELRRLPTKWIHSLWTAPDDVLRKSGITLGEDYPEPIVDHGEARTLALEAFAKIKK
ncbi:MAG: deoxyribodipyrimidine photo-lyase [Planctomycetaceae bacterium]|nr:deoxyribodipyrimidine photo-lyase [Planctomycetaceae bacterium]